MILKLWILRLNKTRIWFIHSRTRRSTNQYCCTLWTFRNLLLLETTSTSIKDTNITINITCYMTYQLKTNTYTGLFKMIVGVLTTCHTQYSWDRSICIFLFNRTTLQVFVTYLIGALYVHPLWFYKHQHDNRVRSKLFVACNNLQFQDACRKKRNINLILDVTP
jgi:hypothetical protein